MNRRELLGMLLGAAAMLAAIRLADRSADVPECRSWTFPVMGTVARFTFYASEAEAERAGAAAKAAFDRVAAACNRHDPASELSQLNREAARRPFVCGEVLWQVLQEARRAHRLSGGAFDVTIDPLMRCWGFYRKHGGDPPDAKAIAAAKSRVGLDLVRFDDAKHSIFFTRSEMAIDLGGIAKGFAADLAAAAAVRCGVRRGVIDLGGNLRFLPEAPPGAKNYAVLIRRPDGSGETAEGSFTAPPGSAVSTSGSYERYILYRGKRMGHLIDPATGYPGERRGSVTASAPDAVSADWLSSAVFLRGGKLAEELRRQLPGVEFRFTDPAGRTGEADGAF